MSPALIRLAERKDCPDILKLIKELAVFENAIEEVENNVTQLEKDGFGANPFFHCLLAEIDGQIVGMSLWYYRYSTWKGVRLYLEDLIVAQEHRQKGVGKALFNSTIDMAKKNNCTGMTWAVLNWNEPAKKFYKDYDANFDDEWELCNLNFFD